MDEDDFFSSRPQDPLTLLVKQDLGPLSVDELNERIETLKAEIARVEQHHGRRRPPPSAPPMSCSSDRLAERAVHCRRRP